MSERYNISEELLKRAEEVIPLGSQTFSKSKTQLPYGISPYFATHAKGAHFWDADGNKYIDFVNGLASITLGHSYDEINQVVSQQLEKGTIFSLASELEIEVAELISEMVPCAEMVRFGKNGSDATSGAIRCARAVTGKDHVLVCGYHGWQDWYIGSTSRSKGVPEVVQNLTHTFKYNDINSLEELFLKYSDQVACVILEPMNIQFPESNFLEKVKSLTHNHNALLVFDETITGFRMSNGGAQEYFNVVPDLATFGKGIANGYPLSVVAGKKEYMKAMEEIFFSFTFGGETLSLAAAKKVLSILKREDIIDGFYKNGELIIAKVNQLIDEFGFQEHFSVSGSPVWSFFNISNVSNIFDIKTYIQQQMFENGVYFLGTHNISYSHSNSDIQILEDSYQQIFSNLKEVGIQNAGSLLKSDPLVPLFKIR